MALVINDRVKETSTTTGTGALTFAGAVSGFETFSAGIGNSSTTYYAIVNTDTPTEWEVGLGTLAGDSSTITRTTPISSSNSDSAVDFGSGTKEIFCTLPASKAVIKDASGNVSPGGVITGTTVETTGDTAASDNAAMGYTSAEGLILTGQGSTNDVTIKNDADADVITIATGATNVDIVGDVTASTLNADGDTAASDNAAIGYTSAEGLILTGQGSTNDVTIKNDADADVITIATGATNVDVVGDLTAGTLNADGDTAAGDNAAIGYTSAEGLILTGQGSTNDVTIKNDADAAVISIPTGATGVTLAGTLGSGAITSTAGISGTQVDITAQGDLRLQDSTGGEYIAHQAAGTTTTYTLTWPGAVATAAGQALKSTTGGVLSWGTAGTAWQGIKTSAYTASAGEGVFADTATTAAFTVTLPASPTIGDEVSIIDCVGNAATANITVGRNSEKIQGAEADLTISTDNAAIKLVYSDSTNGWRLANND
jgi:hypothetical protein